MVVPIDLLKPILDDLLTIGRANRPPRPWLGVYATEVGNNVAILGLASRGPAQRADLRAGDIVLGVGGSAVNDLAGLFRARVGAGPGRRRGAAADQPRRQDLRGARALGRPPPLPQGPRAALSVAVARPSAR